MAEFIDFLKYFKEVRMTGTIQYVNEKEGKRGKYLTLALEDGTKGLIVNNETTMEGVKKGGAIEAVKEGETYELTLEKSGIFTIVADITSVSEQGKAEQGESKMVTTGVADAKPQKPARKPPTGTYHSEYMKRRVPEEQISIASQAFAKALIEAYARLWIADKSLFDTLGEFNEQVRDGADDYVQWLEIEEK